MTAKLTDSPRAARPSEQDSLVLALAMQSSNMGAWERDLAAETVWWSPELEAIFGLEEGEFGGTHESFVELIHVDDRDLAFDAVQDAMESGRSFQYEFRFYHRDGSIRWMEGRGQAIYANDGTPLRLYGVGIDITSRKLAEEKARLLTELGDAVQPLTDPAEIMAVSARLLGDFLGVDRCAYAEVEDESVFVITGDYTRGVPSIVGTWPVAAFGSECRRSMLANEPYVVEDAESDPRITQEDLAAYHATNIRSVICLPLHKNGRLTAAMAVHNQTAHRWTPNEVDIVKLVVNRCWESLERTRAARQIRLSDERFRLALSSGAVTVYEQDTDLRYLWLYPQVYGDGTIGKTDLELTTPEYGEKLTALKMSVMESRKPLRTEVSAKVGGKELWFDLLVEPRFSPSGELTGVGGTALNITDQKAAQLEVIAAAERLSLAFAAADLGEWTWNAATDEVVLSTRAAEIFGLPDGRPIRWKDLQQLLVPGDRESAAAAVERSVETGERYSTEYRIRRPNGDSAYVSAVGRPSTISDGLTVGMYGIVQDITVRKKLEAELRDSEARFRGLMEQAPMSIQIYDASGRHIQVNRAWEELWGLRFEDIPEYNVLADPQLEEKGVAPILRRVFAGETAELPLIKYDPEETIPGGSGNAEPSRWVAAIAYPLKDEEGTVREVALVHQDVTQQKAAEEQLTFQKTVLESLTESVLDGILIVSPNGEMLHHNQRFVDIWNFPENILESRSDADALAWAASRTTDPEAFLQRVQEVYQAPNDQEREEVQMLDGRVFERYGAPVFYGETRLGWVWTFRDITDRKMVEQALEMRVAERTHDLAKANEMLIAEMEERARSEEERIDLLKRIFTIQEAERGRIARDIHDQLGQRVTALRIKTALMRSRCGDDPELAQQADALEEIAVQLDHEVSFVAWELRPSILDDLSFADALNNFVTEWSRHSGIKAEFHVSGAADLAVGRDVETNMYRIVQEALNNAAKHSKATQVHVLLERRSADMMLIVEDNGVGIGVTGDNRREGLKGLGLKGMRERASLVGGTLEIESSATGTSLFIRIPFSPTDDERRPALV